MKKILLFFILFVLVFCMAFPASGSEIITFDFFHDPHGDNAVLISDPVLANLAPGSYNYTISVSAAGGRSYSGVCSLVPVVQDGITFLFFSFIKYDSSVDLLMPFYFSFVDFSLLDPSLSPGIFLCQLALEGNQIFYDVSLTLEKINNPGFSEAINSSLDSVLIWIQSFTSALFSGDLSPLLSVFLIGICIAALFLGIRFIYKSCWGC